MSDKIKRTIGWNSSYFGEPKKGSLAATIADITSKQNELVGGKPEVQDSMAVTAAKQAETQKESVNVSEIKRNYKRDKNFFVNDKTDTLKKMSGRQGYNKSTLTDYLAQKSNKKEDDVYFDDTDLVYKDKTVLKNAETKTVDQMLKALQKEEVKKDKKEEDEEDMAQKDAKTKDKGNVKIHGEKFEQAKQFSVASMKEALAKVYAEAARNKEEGNSFTKSLMAAKEKGEKTFTVAGKQYNVEQELDKVNPVAVKKKFDDRKDKDIDNDGDVDSSDKYLHKRRQAISKAVK